MSSIASLVIERLTIVVRLLIFCIPSGRLSGLFSFFSSDPKTDCAYVSFVCGIFGVAEEVEAKEDVEARDEEVDAILLLLTRIALDGASSRSIKLGQRNVGSTSQLAIPLLTVRANIILTPKTNERKQQLLTPSTKRHYKRSE
jgi:hypothetical protein